MRKNSRGSIYKSTGNLHTEQNQSMPELGLVAVAWERDGSLQPAAVFLGLGFFGCYCGLFVFNDYL